MRYLLLLTTFALLAGCATAATTGNPGAFYDRKYNTYYPVRADADSTRARSAVYDRKYNAYLPVSGSGSSR